MGGQGNVKKAGRSGFLGSRARVVQDQLQRDLTHAPSAVQKSGRSVVESMDRDETPDVEDVSRVLVWLVERRAAARKRKTSQPARKHGKGSRLEETPSAPRKKPKKPKKLKKPKRSAFRPNMESQGPTRADRLRRALDLSPSKSRVEIDSNGRRVLVASGDD